MAGFARFGWVGVGLGIVAVTGMPALLSADTKAAKTAAIEKPAPAVSDAPVAAKHPLMPVIKYAKQEQAYLQQTVRDFTCRLVKRERIDGFLQDNQYIEMAVREEHREGDRVERPLSIFLRFLGPSSVAGRKVLYVAGENEDKMLVRNGGKHFDYVVVKLDPDGDTVKDESMVPITETGFRNVLARMIQTLEQHAAADPTGANTKVEKLSGAKINKQSCTLLRITHPKPQPGLQFHMANVFVDDKLRVPVRIDFSEWPKRANQPPQLIAEYTYTNLKLNVNLSDGTFKPAVLRGH